MRNKDCCVVAWLLQQVGQTICTAIDVFTSLHDVVVVHSWHIWPYIAMHSNWNCHSVTTTAFEVRFVCRMMIKRAKETTLTTNTIHQNNQ